MFKHNYQKEVWLPINDVAWSSCEVSNLGNVRKGRKIKSLTLRKDGYLVTGIRQNNKATTQLVHILVAKTFIENKTGFKYVNHIDGVKSNNKASNLTWCSQSENIRHSISLGTFSNGKYPSSNYAKNLYRPVRSFQNELWDNLPDFEDKYQVSNLGGESIREFDSVVDAAKYLNVKPDSIYNCAKKKSKTAHSYQWEYKK
jgi:hypothetical protein